LSGGALAEGLKKGLVLRYSFGRDEGGKVKDESGSGNDGTVDGAKWIEKGGAYAFNGSSARIAINNSPSLDFGAGARTIAAWIKSSGASGSHQEIFNKGTNPGYAFRLAPSPARAIEYFKSAGANYSFFTSSHTITDDAWHHLAVVDHGNGTVDFYKGGVFLETVTKTNYNSDSGGRAAIGAWTDASFAQCYNGSIDELAVYNRALSAEEVRALCGAQKNLVQCVDRSCLRR
jgi:arabinan endo-1,5-alpha-L-arabinosidase